MRKSKKGFTIVEILVVIILISLIATVIVPRMFQGIGAQRAKITKAKMATLETALGRFYLDCDRYPDDSEGLDVLVNCPSDLTEKWKGPYLKQSDLLDAWQNPYVYSANASNASGFVLMSYGADGVEGGEGDNADIYND